MGLKLGVEDPEQWLEDCPQRVFDGWQAAYSLRPFGDEQELLKRIVSLLILIASKNTDFETVMNVSNSIMKSPLLASEVFKTNIDTPRTVNVDSVASFESVVSKVFA